MNAQNWDAAYKELSYKPLQEGMAAAARIAELAELIPHRRAELMIRAVEVFDRTWAMYEDYPR